MNHLATLLTSLLLVSAPALLPAQVTAQTTRYVDGAAGSDDSDCTTDANPCLTITYAIGQAAPSDTIAIADGEYTEALTIDTTLALHGESEAGTIIQAHELPGEAESRVITIDGEFSVDIADMTVRYGVEDAIFNAGGGGILVDGGAAVTLTNATLTDNVVIGGNGGGLRVRGESSLTLRNVTFTGNEAASGGGLANNSSPLGMTTVALTDVVFMGNNAGGSFGRGGGMKSTGGSLTLTNVSFIENTAGGNGGGMHINGGDPVLTSVTFSGNTAENQGGGLYSGSGSPALANVTFSDNIASVAGGGMNLSGGSPTLTNVVFVENSANTQGGGIYINSGSSPTFTNVSFSQNTAGGTGGGLYNRNSSSVLSNTIVWGNTATEGGNEIYNTPDGSIALSYSLYGNGEGDIVESDGFTAENSLTVDPLFVDPENGDLHLMEESPAINCGDPATPDSLFATDESGEPIDLDGFPRTAGDAIDIGAYEYQGGVSDPCAVMAPEATITPEAFAFEVPAGGNADEPLTIGNTGGSPLEWSIGEAEGAPAGAGNWADDFDSYEAGSNLHGQGGWKGWDNNPSFGASVADAEASSTPHSVAIEGASDLVREFEGYDSGRLTLSMQQFIPEDFSGQAYLVVLNDYEDGAGEGNSWSVQVRFRSATGQIRNTGTTFGSLPLILGEWVEVRLEIDLDDDTQEFYYNDELLYAGTWTDEVTPGGQLVLDAIDFFANEASVIYYDDMSVVVEGSEPGSCEAPGDVPWLSVSPASGTTAPGGSEEVTVAVDATDMEPGEHTARLCVTTNDPAAELVEVPVTMTIDGVDNEASPGEITEGLTVPHPNPAYGTTTVSIAAREAQHVTVEVFDATGRRVQTLHDGTLPAGTSETLTLDASALPAGVYVIRATGETFAETRRVTVVR